MRLCERCLAPQEMRFILKSKIESWQGKKLCFSCIKIVIKDLPLEQEVQLEASK